MMRDAPRLLQPLAEIFARILMSSCSSLPYSSLARIPARVPGTVDAQAQAGWINFLTHQAASFFFGRLLAPMLCCVLWPATTCFQTSVLYRPRCP